MAEGVKESGCVVCSIHVECRGGVSGVERYRGIIRGGQSVVYGGHFYEKVEVWYVVTSSLVWDAKSKHR